MLELIKRSLADAVPFVRHTGIQLLDVGDGHAVARLGDAPELKNHLGTLHAGALYTAGETASGAALAGALGARLFEVMPVVTTASIDYLRPARGAVTAAATIGLPSAELQSRLARDGRVALQVRVSIADTEGSEVAAMRVDWLVRRRRQDAEA